MSSSARFLSPSEAAKRLGRPVLISSDFANVLAEPLVPAGAHAMRDIGRSEKVFALPAAA